MGRVDCDLQYSGAAFLALLVGAVGGVALALGLRVSMPLQAALAVYVVAQAVRAARELLRPTGLHLEADGRIEVLDDGRWRSGQVRDGSFVTPALTIIRWRPDGARFDRSLLLLAPMAPPDAMRRIRVILRWRKEYRGSGNLNKGKQQ